MGWVVRKDKSLFFNQNTDAFPFKISRWVLGCEAKCQCMVMRRGQ